jgi:hypothetical protein
MNCKNYSEFFKIINFKECRTQYVNAKAAVIRDRFADVSLVLLLSTTKRKKNYEEIFAFSIKDKSIAFFDD